jgi:hypothetical protein
MGFDLDVWHQEPVCASAPFLPGDFGPPILAKIIARIVAGKFVIGQSCWGGAAPESSVQGNHPQIVLDEGTISGVDSQSRRSIRPPHSRQTMNSSLNVSYGPQSSPCVSTEATVRKSPADELQSGHAMSVFSSDKQCRGQNAGRSASSASEPPPHFWEQFRVPP